MSHRISRIEEKLVERIAGSDFRGMAFSEIVDFAQKSNISRATAARYLKKLVEKGIIKKEGSYRLAMAAVHWKFAQRNLFSVLSMNIFNDLLEKSGSGKLSDDGFAEAFTKKVGLLAMYTFLTGLSQSTNNPTEAGKWIEEAFGTLIQKDGWRRCLNRQIFRKKVKLKRPIELKESALPKILVEDETIFVRPPHAIEPGFSESVLKELPPIPEERLSDLMSSLKRLCGEEVRILEEMLNQIRQVAETSKEGKS